MSAKRRPGTELNHENWNDEEETEEIGEFQKASQDELKRRTIKKAVRRTRVGGAATFGGNDITDGATDDDPKPSGSVFSGFGGFGSLASKSISSPFSFLSSTTAQTTTTVQVPTTTTTASSTLSTKSLLNGNSNTTGSTITGISSIGSFSLKSPSSSIAADNNSTDYYAQLKGLNQSVSAWISKHVDANPICILTPIFDEYAKFLKDIEQTKGKSSTATTNKTDFNFAASKPPTTTTAPSSFSFGIKDSSSKIVAATAPVKLGASVFEPTAGPSKPISFGSTTAPFSFGGSTSSTPFTFANVRKPDEHPPAAAGGSSSSTTGADDENEEPPKNEFTPVVEEDSLFSKRCKVFVKGTAGYVDRGVGTLYIKSADNGNKTQMIVRADTNLGNVIFNILLTDAVPANRMGKNNVMMICIPTPDSKPPPSTVLIRVKNGEEADELLEQINKHKK